MKKSIIILSLLCIACSNHSNKENTDFQLKIGDILFQDLDSSPLCDAIELVTPGYKEGNFSHIGIVSDVLPKNPFCFDGSYNYKENIRILEAIPDKVKTTRLDSFLNRSFDNNKNPKVIVGRLKPKYQYTITNAITFLKTKIGIRYDKEFILNNDSYYCSELIYEAFEKDSLFKLEPMTFLHPETQETLEGWRKYYSKIETQIPQNKLGINPGAMSISEKIEIIHIYGIPEGMKK